MIKYGICKQKLISSLYKELSQVSKEPPKRGENRIQIGSSHESIGKESQTGSYLKKLRQK